MVFFVGVYTRSGMARKQKPLIFPLLIPWIYRWVDPEVLGIPSAVTFLHHFREGNLITSEDEYKEEYVLEAPGSSDRVCYINHDGGLRWLWMYEVLIAKLGV